MILDFVVTGEPIAQPRPRAVVERYGQKSFPRLYACDPKHPVMAYKRSIAGDAKDIAGIEPMTCGLGIELTFVMPRTKGLTWKKKPMPRVPCLDVPDIDNLTKAVLDALAKIVWRDDRQVFGLRASKWYAAGDETAHTKITIYTTVDEFFWGVPNNGQQ